MEQGVSVIIPTYNRKDLLPNAICSVLEQNMRRWELIIVDDGSTDDTLNAIAEYVELNNVQYFYQEHKGVSEARNFGLKKSSMSHVIFLDSDDIFIPGLFNYLEYEKFENYDLIFWSVQKKKEDEVSVWKPKKLEKIYNEVEAIFLAGSVCFRKEILDIAGRFDKTLKFGENYELGMRIAQISNLKTHIINQPFLINNVRLSNRTNSNPDIKVKSLKYLLNKHLQTYKKDSYSYSRLLYQIGYLNEKLGRYGEAIEYYKKAGKIRNLYWKPHIKRILFIFKKLPT